MLKVRIMVLRTCLRLCDRLDVVLVAYGGSTSLFVVYLKPILSSKCFQLLEPHTVDLSVLEKM